LKSCLSNKKIQEVLKSGYKSGSVLLRIVLKDLKQLKIIIPPKAHIDSFGNYIDPLCQMIRENSKQSHVLIHRLYLCDDLRY
jgi:restriction endonuclease S subunit